MVSRWPLKDPNISIVVYLLADVMGMVKVRVGLSTLGVSQWEIKVSATEIRKINHCMLM